MTCSLRSLGTNDGVLISRVVFPPRDSEASTCYGRVHVDIFKPSFPDLVLVVIVSEKAPFQFQKVQKTRTGLSCGCGFAP